MKIENQEAPYWVALSAVPQLGPVHFKKLIDIFKTAEQAWKATDQVINSLDFFPRVKASLITNRKKIDPQQELEKVAQARISLLTFLEPEYPPLLHEIYDPPPLLYLKGQPSALSNLSLAVIGTRKITPYGLRVTEYFVRDLVARGFTLVSGLARGTDSLVHQKTIENGGITMAVLGSGLDTIYPPENRRLAEQICEQGLLISEFPLGMPPLKINFPIRNRLISGLTLGLLVIEAAEQSGTSITAQQALEQNREVFAVPGSIFNPLSKGTLKLIKSGAQLAESAEDICETLNLENRLNIPAQNYSCKTKEEEIVYNLLKNADALSVDEIKRQSGLPITQINSLLTNMEIQRKVIALGGTQYAVKKS